MERTREELIEAAERGRAVKSLLDDKYVKSVFDDSLACAREQICGLSPADQMAFTIGKASVEAIENFRNGLLVIVADGVDAEQSLENFDKPKEHKRKGIL